MEEGGGERGPSPVPPQQGPCWESVGVQGGGVLRLPHRQLPLLSSCPFSILSCGGKGGQRARPRMKANPPRGRVLEEGPGSGPKTSAQNPSEAPLSTRTVGPCYLPAPSTNPAPCAQPLGQGEAASPCQTPPGVGCEAPKTGGELGEKGAAEVGAGGGGVLLPPRAPRTKINSASTGLWPRSSSAATKSHRWCQKERAKPTGGVG